MMSTAERGRLLAEATVRATAAMQRFNEGYRHFSELRRIETEKRDAINKIRGRA